MRRLSRQLQEWFAVAALLLLYCLPASFAEDQTGLVTFTRTDDGIGTSKFSARCVFASEATRDFLGSLNSFDLNHTVIIPQDHKVLCTEKDNTLAGSFVLLKVRETSDYPYRDACAGGSHTDSATLNLWDLFKKAGVIGTISIDLKNAEPGIFYKQMKYAFHNSEIPLVQLSCDYPHHISDAEIQDVWLSPGEVRVRGKRRKTDGSHFMMQMDTLRFTAGSFLVDIF